MVHCKLNEARQPMLPSLALHLLIAVPQWLYLRPVNAMGSQWPTEVKRAYYFLLVVLEICVCVCVCACVCVC